MTILIDADGCPVVDLTLQDVVVTQNYGLASMCLANRPESPPVAAEAQKEKVADSFESATSGGDGGIRTHVPG